MTNSHAEVARFLASLSGSHPPQDFPSLAQALWYDAHGDWARAHALVQAESSVGAAAVHAYLHRKEGDLANADYWYARAGSARSHMALEVEWRALVEGVLAGDGERETQ